MIEASPLATFPVVLKQHQNQPPELQPRLIFRALRRRDTKVLLGLIQRITDVQLNTSEQQGVVLLDEIEAFLRQRLAGWERQTDAAGRPVPFDVDRFDEVVDDADMMELILRLHGESTATAGERKKSASQSPSSSELSAPAAAPAGV
jgi:hypothetical protein